LRQTIDPVPFARDQTDRSDQVVRVFDLLYFLFLTGSVVRTENHYCGEKTNKSYVETQKKRI
jgi:hypothetical protein